MDTCPALLRKLDMKKQQLGRRSPFNWPNTVPSVVATAREQSAAASISVGRGEIPAIHKVTKRYPPLRRVTRRGEPCAAHPSSQLRLPFSPCRRRVWTIGRRAPPSSLPAEPNVEDNFILLNNNY